MNRLLALLSVIAFTLIPLVAEAYDTLGSVQIVRLAPRVGGYTTTAGTTAFFIEINASYAHSCGAVSPATYFGIDSSLIASPQYRDHVAAVMLAFSQGRSLNLFVSGCVGTLPRIVGLDVL